MSKYSNLSKRDLIVLLKNRDEKIKRLKRSSRMAVHIPSVFTPPDLQDAGGKKYDDRSSTSRMQNPNKVKMTTMT